MMSQHMQVKTELSGIAIHHQLNEEHVLHHCTADTVFWLKLSSHREHSGAWSVALIEVTLAVVTSMCSHLSHCSERRLAFVYSLVSTPISMVDSKLIFSHLKLFKTWYCGGPYLETRGMPPKVHSEGCWNLYIYMSTQLFTVIQCPVLWWSIPRDNRHMVMGVVGMPAASPKVHSEGCWSNYRGWWPSSVELPVTILTSEKTSAQPFPLLVVGSSERSLLL